MNKVLRPAMAMIELIFAIVVIGIALLSVPIIVSQATSSTFTAFQQESIAIAASHASAILTYEWDESNTGINSGKILNVTSGDVDLNQTLGQIVRGSTTLFPNARKRQFVSSGINFFSTTTLGNDSNESNDSTFTDDIDDFIVQPLSLRISSVTLNDTDRGDYIDKNISISTSVVYINDTATYGSASNAGFAFSSPYVSMPNGISTNIKHITINLTTNNLNTVLQDKNITFNAFMCNIGAGTPANRAGY